MSRPVLLLRLPPMLLLLVLIIFLLCGGGGPIFFWAPPDETMTTTRFVVSGLALVTPSPLSSKIDRRKSPALWRLLQYEEDEDAVPLLTIKSAASSAVQKQKRKRQRRAKKPEIMSPAGGWPQLRAAVANGADAVYLGLSAFSARARAINFDETNLYDAVTFAHRHQVNVYVAMNTLIFDRELTSVARWIQICQTANVDALIVQDLGLAQFIRRLAPNMPIHVSTQQTITDAAGVLFGRDAINATRVVLGRELSTVEIAAIIDRINDTDHDNDDNDNGRSITPEIEVFVHGALCVSYSGQCFSSEAWGGRSANRGQCAQACRLPYELIVNGAVYDQPRHRGKNNDNHDDLKYVLSPQDLCGLDQVPALMRAGVACFKIEGRLKDAEYVAATTRAYRNAVDLEWQRLHPEEKQNDDSIIIVPEEHIVHRQELVQLFSRGQDETHDGLTPGFLDGTHHQRLVRGRSPRHRGVHVGRVGTGTTSLQRGRIVVNVDDIHNNNAAALKLGDGICIDRGLAQEPELGGSIFAIQDLGDNRLAIQLGRSETQMWQDHDANRRRRLGGDGSKNHDVAVDGKERELVPIGAHVWKTYDAVVERKFRKLSELPPPRRHAVTIRVDGTIGRPLTITMADDWGSVSAKSSNHLVASERGTGMDGDKIRKAIGTLGNTDYYISNGSVDLSGLDETAWCPISWVKDTRRAAVELWEAHIKKRDETAQQQQQLLQKSLSTDLTYQELQSHIDVLIAAGVQVDEKDQEEAVAAKTAPTTLSILCREYSQVSAICDALDSADDDDDMRSVVGEIVVDFLEVDGMRAAVDRIHQSGITSIVASPRILKPGEGGIWRSLLSLQPGGLLIRSTGLLHQLQTMGGTGARVEVGTVEKSQQVTIPKLFGDFSLNAANALTVSDLLNRGLERITASYDINAGSIAEMASLLGPKSHRLEVVIHCKMPIFHTEHCVFARFLTKGDSYMDCGHACTRNTLHLRDTLSGGDNLVLADMGCRNTVFSAKAQSGIYSLQEWISSGVRKFRVELVDEQPADAALIFQTYAEALINKSGPSHVWNVLQNVPDSNGRVHGVTLGSFQNSPERKAGQL